MAGDGFAYLAYAYEDSSGLGGHLKVLRVDSSGAYTQIGVFDWRGPHTDLFPFNGQSALITNAGDGVLLSWWDQSGRGAPVPHWTAISSTGMTDANGPVIPGQAQSATSPVLLREDGSFIGLAMVGDRFATFNQLIPYMVAFDASGNVLWSVANDQPQIAVAGGGVIGHSGIVYDQTGSAIGQVGQVGTWRLPNGNATGQIGNQITYSWKGAYQASSIVFSVVPSFDLAFLAQTKAAVPNGNLTGNGFALAHRTFGLVFCGPNAPNDGPCNGGSGATDPPPFDAVRYAYLEAANLNSTTYTAAADFSQNQTGGAKWPDIIKAEAYTQYKAAFDHLAAIVAHDIKPLFSGNSSGKFMHTVYVRGGWSDIEMGNTQPNGSCRTIVDGNKQVCVWSELFFMSYVDQSQQALAYLITNDTGNPPPVSPHYSNSLDSTTETQFVRLMNTFGFGIGAGAAHETGHQIFLPHMDCSTTNQPVCPEDRTYENGGGGSNHPWFYGNLTGQRIHWSADAVCALKRYLLATYTLPCN